MFQYKFYKFLNTNYCLTINISQTKFLIGNFFDENSLINLNENNNFPFNNEEEKNILEIFHELNIIICNDFNSLINLPFIITKFNIDLNNLKIYSTEALLQLSRSYINEFYSNFNKIIIENNLKENYNDNNSFFIEEKEIEIVFNKIILINFNQEINKLIEEFEAPISFQLISNGYELGTSNIIIKYFNKKILILTKSSLFENRYPKEFDLINSKNCEFLLKFPNIINDDEIKNDYEKNLKNLIYKINQNSQKILEAKFYPRQFLIVDPFFLLEFCDIIRFRIKPEIKNIFINSSADSIIKYSNINTSFIRDKFIEKIYDFKMPFSFEDIKKEKKFYIANNILDMLENKEITNKIDISINPMNFYVFRFPFYSEKINDIYQFFLNYINYKQDQIFVINCDSQKIYKKFDKNFIINNFILDYRLTIEQYNKIINIIKPKTILENNFDFIIKNFNNDDILYENSYILYNLKENDDINLNVEKQNLKLLFSKENNQNEIINKQSETKIDLLENILKKYLSMNNMKIYEILNKEKTIEISIIKENSNNSTEIEIDFTNLENPLISINTESYEDSLFLNVLLSQIFE